MMLIEEGKSGSIKKGNDVGYCKEIITKFLSSTTGRNDSPTDILSDGFSKTLSRPISKSSSNVPQAHLSYDRKGLHSIILFRKILPPRGKSDSLEMFHFPTMGSI